jgi:hypothetical protein
MDAPSSLAAGLHEAALVGEDDGLDSVAHVELAKDARDVWLDGRLADDELRGDFGI